MAIIKSIILKINDKGGIEAVKTAAARATANCQIATREQKEKFKLLQSVWF